MQYWLMHSEFIAVSFLVSLKQ